MVAVARGLRAIIQAVQVVVNLQAEPNSPLLPKGPAASVRYDVVTVLEMYGT